MIVPTRPTMYPAFAVPRFAGLISPRSIDFTSERPISIPTTDRGPQQRSPKIDSTSAVVAWLDFAYWGTAYCPGHPYPPAPYWAGALVGRRHLLGGI